jgi:flavin-dependent dehydrogenase
VAGAGPAGSALAARLARAGVEVLLVEASTSEHEKAGEFLAPQARAAVNRAQVLGADWETRHRPVHEFVSRWGTSHASTRDFIFQAHGHALALDRALFDRELAAAAVFHGASLVAQARVREVLPRRNQWTVGIQRGLEHFTVRTSFLVMSVGRIGTRIAGIHTARRRLDHLFCLGMRIANCTGDFGPSIESYSRGWAYSVALPSEHLVINICTESNGQTGRRFRSASVMLEELSECPIAASRVLASSTESSSDVSFFFADASSTITRPAVGKGWCLAGDCAQSMDPLSSSGIMNAFHHSELIFECLSHGRNLHDSDLDAYSEWLDQNYREYLTARQRFYSLEPRWSSPFWQERQKIDYQKRVPFLDFAHPNSRPNTPA